MIMHGRMAVATGKGKGAMEAFAMCAYVCSIYFCGICTCPIFASLCIQGASNLGAL